jgi:ABC-type nitrate/sulfonate/bicarbonate transport system substrate-binding protein
MQRKSYLLVVGLAVALATASAAANGQSAGQPGAEPESLSFGAYPGSQDIVLFAIADQHFDHTHGLDLQVKRFQSVPALNAAVVSGAVQAGFASLTNMAAARAQGRDVIIFNALLGASEVVLVPKDSKIVSMSDLNGQKLGSFGGSTSTAFAVLAMGAKAAGQNPVLANAVSVVSAPDAVLLGLLDNGELKAALISSGGTVPALLTGKYRVLVNIRQQYEKYFGAPPGQVMVTTTEAYAKGHGSVLKKFSAALADGVSYVLNTPTVWQEYASSVKITDPAAGAQFQQLLGGAFITRWDAAATKVQYEFIRQLIGIVGAKNLVEKVPDGLFTTAYTLDEK